MTDHLLLDEPVTITVTCRTSLGRQWLRPQARRRLRGLLGRQLTDRSEVDGALALVEFGNAGRASRALEWGRG